MKRSCSSVYALAGALLAVAGASTTVFGQTTATQPYAFRNVQIGGGGFVSGIVFHPTARDLFYARTDVGGAYICKGANRRWIPITDSLGRNDTLGVLSVALDARDARRVYLALGQYTQSWAGNAFLLHSADQGQTWSRTNLPFKLGGNEDGRSAGERLQVDPNLGSILLLGTNDAGLWRSADAALTWSKVESFPEASLTFVLFDKSSGEPGSATPTVYAGVNNTTTGLYRSSDGGVTWTLVPGQPTGLIPNHAAFDRKGILYLTYADRLGPNGMTNGAVWKLDPTTGAWTDITPDAAPYFGYGGLAVDARRPGTLIVSTMDRWSPHDELYRSRDGGATWTPLTPVSHYHSEAPWIFWHRDPGEYYPHWVGDVEIDPHDSDRVLYVTGGGVWRTDSLAAVDPCSMRCKGRGHCRHHSERIVWDFFNQGLEETVPLGMVSPPVGAPLLSALGDIGGFKHDRLRRYQPEPNFYEPIGSTNTWIDFAELNPALVVRSNWGTARGDISSDGGATWAELPASPPPALANGPGAMAIAADGGRIVWLPRGSQPYFSTDLGATWTPSAGGPTDAASYLTTLPTADRVNPLKFYVYEPFGAGVYVSSDGGATFAQTASNLSPYAGGILRATPGREGDLWLPRAWDGLYRSTDSGASFVRVKSVQEGYQIGFGTPAPEASYPAIFLWGRVKGTTGIFRSDDGGASWIRINDDQHQYGWINAVIGDPRVHGRVYLATGGRGIIFGDAIGEIVEPPPPPPVVAEPIYTDALATGWEDVGWATRNLASTAVVHSGSAAISASADPWAALWFRNPAGFDTTGFQSLSFWIHGGDAGGQALQAAIDIGWSWSGYVPIPAPEPGVWQPVVIPLADLSGADTMINGVIIQALGDGAATFHVDDIELQKPAP
jgi:photosystem II stability/assembly factor-like uncharacterized protein